MIPALVAAVLLASCGQTAVVLSDGSPAPEPYRTWVASSRMPLPPTRIVLHINEPDGCRDACAAPGQSEGTADLWLGPDIVGARREAFMHELGHVFDYAMSDAARVQFRRLTKDPRPWRTSPNSPHEQFAEAWRMCATGDREGSYGWTPSANVQRQACALIRSEASSQGWH